MNIPLTDPNDPIYPLMSEMVDKFSGKGSDIYYNSVSLTKREYFAVMALQGILSASKLSGNEIIYAQAAIKIGDALIKELNKTNYEHQSKPNDGGA